MDPAPQPQDPAQLISDLAERVPNIRHVLVVSADGVPLAASRQTPAQHLNKLAATTSSLISLAHTTATILDYGPVTQAVVVMEEGTFIIIIIAVDAGASLAVLTTAAADLDQVAYEMTMLVEHSALTLTTPARNPAPAPAP